MRDNQSRTGRPKTVPPSPAPLQNNLAYVVPTEFVELPSRGRFYPEDHALHGQETVEIKYMTAKDEDILSSTALLKKGLALDRLLENILVIDVDPADLLVADRNAIMIAARISGYGWDYNVSAPCPNCETKVDHTFDLKESKMNEKCFDHMFLENKNVCYDEDQKVFSVVLPVSGIEVCVGILTGKEEKELMNADEERNVTSLLAALIASVSGDYSHQAVEAFVDNMPAADSKFYLSSLLP